MLFNSGQFLVFFPITLLLYYVIPKRVRYLWLLAASYFFYMGWNPKYALLLLSSTVITYASGYLIDRINHQKIDAARQIKLKKAVVAASLVINLSILFYYKYINFALSLVTDLFSNFGVTLQVPTFDVILPVGISFFTFQALSYTIDVYRGDIYAEKNFFRYALFVSFFPQLVAGPIERSKNLLKQLAKPKPFTFENLQNGVLLMLWGYFLKMILADRIAIFVDTVYNDYYTYSGYYLLIATILFGVQIYCDFAGYSTIAMGAAMILGIQLMENFDAPYLSYTVADFWRKWHISLTSWFKDYLYIPLGGSRKGKLRKYLNKMIVFLVSGLWHGASLTFVVWGGLNGLYQVIGEILMPIRKKLAVRLHIHEEAFSTKLVRLLLTFVMVDFAWVFFRAKTLEDAVNILGEMFRFHNPEILFDDASLYMCGLNEQNFRLMIIGILILVFADIMKHKGFKMRPFLIAQDAWFRWVFVGGCICLILTFGLWARASVKPTLSISNSE